MRVGIGDAERLRVSRPPPHPPQCAHWGTFPPVGGRLWVRSNREEFGALWDVWIHILGIVVECALLLLRHEKTKDIQRAVPRY